MMEILGSIFGIFGFLALLVFFSPSRSSAGGGANGGGGECACDDDYGFFWGCRDSDGDGICDSWDDE